MKSKSFVLLALLSMLAPTASQAQPHIPEPNQGEASRAPSSRQPGDNRIAFQLAAGAMFLQQASQLVERRIKDAGQSPRASAPNSWDQSGVRDAIRQLSDFGTRLRAAVNAAELSASGQPLGNVALNDQQRQEMNQLSRITLDHLETRYVEAMIGQLQQERQDFKQSVNGRSEAAYRNLAEQNLPEIERHLETLQRIETTRR